jgi:hypothetical protein
LDRARRGFKDFQATVPNGKTVSQIKAWLQPFRVTSGGVEFWEALHRAGAGN